MPGSLLSVHVGVNDAVKDLLAAGRELTEIGFRGLVELLPFHRLGQAKYDALGKNYLFAETEPPSDETMRRLKNVLRSDCPALNIKE